MADENKRVYRKNLASQGLIYLAEQELKVSVKNLSITGLLVEIDSNDVVTSIEKVFQELKVSPIIDLYLPEIRLAGEVEVVRAEILDGIISLGLEFSNISHDVDNYLYKRQSYRKNMTAPGQIILNGKKYHFTTENVSVDGLMVHIDERIDVEKGTVTIFDFKRLKLRGEIEISWVEHPKDSSTLLGLKYLHMEKDSIKGIPQFSSAKLLD